eukprot:CAMPEP_0198596530 /NCGR_PEP_ID=MMETSP1462-20131121/143297_1 /TAXON_ID=1333877 /ORGANISM="Brandtodinium nutriculum, Strain RCC3387" /LENGTH=44 /DNA_ID= /DNA_START= /DNA_END= /DNA_ORIENTATION=
MPRIRARRKDLAERPAERMADAHDFVAGLELWAHMLENMPRDLP